MLSTPEWRIELADRVSVVRWSPDGRQLLAGSLAGDGLVLEPSSGEVLAKLAHHSMGILAGSWSPDGSRLAVGGQDGVLRLYDRSGEELPALVHPGWVTSLAWSSRRGLLAVAINRTLFVLDADARVVRRYPPAPSTITSVAWSADGTRIGVAAYGGLVWYDPSVDSDEPVCSFEWKGSLLTVVVAPNGKWACAGSQDATVHLWRLWSGEDLSMSGYPAKIEHLAFRHDSRWMADACQDALTVWDFGGKGPSGSRPAQGDAHDLPITDLAWQPRGKLLATGGADGRIVLWPSPRGQGDVLKPDQVIQGEVGVALLGWAPKGDHLAVGGADGTVQVQVPR